MGMNAIRKRFLRPRAGLPPQPVEAQPSGRVEAPDPGAVTHRAIPPDDPLLPYVLNANGAIDLHRLQLDSPTLHELRAAGYRISIPLISQGELIGLLNLGPRRSDQDYSSEDVRFLNSLATQAAPALRLAQVARQQQIEAADRERLDQELRVARVIQQTLLPPEVPRLENWTMQAFWKPARAVSGDFYDFIHYADGRLGVIIADVTDKGVPAALVMATTRSVLRLAAEQFQSPGQILERVNNLLLPDIPPNMFVTCFFLLLDPASGQVRYANAGHPLALWRTRGGVRELQARGMPLGLMEGMHYEEMEAVLEPGDGLLLYSDGLVEAHDPGGEMFSSARLRETSGNGLCGLELISCLLDELDRFTGPEWEQEDDVTLVSIERGPA